MPDKRPSVPRVGPNLGSVWLVGYTDIWAAVPASKRSVLWSPDKNDARSAALSASIAFQISQRRNDWR